MSAPVWRSGAMMLSSETLRLPPPCGASQAAAMASLYHRN